MSIFQKRDDFISSHQGGGETDHRSSAVPRGRGRCGKPRCRWPRQAAEGEVRFRNRVLQVEHCRATRRLVDAQAPGGRDEGPGPSRQARGLCRGGAGRALLGRRAPSPFPARPRKGERSKQVCAGKGQRGKSLREEGGRIFRAQAPCAHTLVYMMMVPGSTTSSLISLWGSTMAPLSRTSSLTTTSSPMTALLSTRAQAPTAQPQPMMESCTRE